MAPAEKLICVFIAETIATLKTGDNVNIFGFGTFSAVACAARTGRNPQTGATIMIAAKTNGKFTPGKDLKDLHAKPAEVTKPAKTVKAPAKKK